MSHLPSGKRWSIYLRIGISVILILLILYWIDYVAALKMLARTDARYVLLILAVVVFDRFLMAYKWNLLLRARGIMISNSEAFRVYMASGFAGTFLPTGIGGDVFRAARIKLGGYRMDGVAASIVVERVIGLLALTVLAFLGLTVLIKIDESQFIGLYYAVLLFLIALVSGIFLSVHQRTFNLIRRLLAGIEKYRPIRMYLDFHSAYMDLSRHSMVLLQYFTLSVLEHAVMVMACYWAAKAIALSVQTIYFFALVPLSTLVILLPISINAIGVQEGAYIVLFAQAGLSSAESLSLSFLMRIVGWIMLIPMGLLFSYEMFKFKRLPISSNINETK